MGDGVVVERGTMSRHTMTPYEAGNYIKHDLVYLAGPFFNDEQRGVCAAIEEICRANGRPMYAPRLACLLPQPSTVSQRFACFNGDVSMAEACDVVLARIDDFDAGTMWEVGFSYAMGKPVVAYSTVPGRGLNLMLAQSCVGFISGLEAVSEFLSEKHMPGFGWDVVKDWKGEVE